jgi:hypothetical protein
MPLVGRPAVQGRRTMLIVGAVGLDESLCEWCAWWLGSAVSGVVFEAGSLSVVVGVRLADDREVVVELVRGGGIGGRGPW